MSVDADVRPLGREASATDPLRLGVLISGRGSNMAALGAACGQPGFPARVEVVVSDHADAPGLERAAGLGLEGEVVERASFDDREGFEDRIAGALESREVELVCLAGFMRVLSPAFVQRFAHRIVNIHPSLLPAFRGLDAPRQAVEYGVRYSGCTVHLVVEEVDAGPIVLQAVVPVKQEDTEEDLADRILAEEHRIYPEAVRLFAAGRLRLRGRRVEILEG